MGKQTFGDIIYQYCLKNNITDIWTDYIELLHELYDVYAHSNNSTFKPLQNTHPLNKLSAVRNCLRRDKRFQQDGWFNTKWGRVTHYIVLKEN